MTYSMVPTAYALLLIVSTAVAAFIVARILRQRSVPGAWATIAMIIAVCVWSGGYALELLATGLDTKLFWAKVQYLGIATVVPLWFIFVFYLLRQSCPLHHFRQLMAIMIIPLGTILLVWTNEAHGLIWSQVALDAAGPWPHLSLKYGPWFWLNVIYSYALLILGTLWTILTLFDSTHLFHRQAVAVVHGMVLVWAANAIYLGGWPLLSGLDPTPFAFTVASLIYAWVFFRLHLLDVMPLARRTIFLELRDAVMVLDLQNRIMDLNPAAQQLAGLSMNMLIGHPITRILGDNHTTLLEQSEPAQQFQTEIKWTGPQGQQIFEMQVLPLMAHGNIVRGRLVVLHDITAPKQAERALQTLNQSLETRVAERTQALQSEINERIQAEEALRNSQNRYRMLVESTHDLIQSVDPDGRFLFVNRTWFELLGYTKQELSELRLWDVLLPSEHEYCHQLFAEMASGAVRVPVRTALRSKDGYVVTVEGTAAARFENGQFAGTYTFLHDITFRVKAEEALQLAEARYRNLFEEAPVMYVITRNEDGMQYIADCNGLFIKTLGYSRAEVLGQSLGKFYSLSSAAAMVSGYQHALNGTFDIEERQLVTHDGRIIDTQLHTNPEVDASGKTVGTRAMFVDISRRKEAEVRLIEMRDQLRNLAHRSESVREEERSRIAREIHDELGQMLTALKLDTGWLSRHLCEEQTAVRCKVDAMSQLISEMIRTVQQISAELRPGMLDTLGLAAAVQWQLREFEARTEIHTQFINELEEDPPLERNLATALFRILQEALTNILRHAQATSILVCLERRDDRVELRVSDNGIGIDLSRVQRPDSFGLIGMRERLFAWNGQIELHGAPNQGTTLTVSVPIQREVKEIAK